MIEWLIANLATILISLLLIAVIAAVIARGVINKKQGRSSCGCGCDGCAMKVSCHK